MNKIFYKIGMGACIFAGIFAVIYYGLHRYDSYHNDKIKEQAGEIAYFRDNTEEKVPAEPSSDMNSASRSGNKAEKSSAINFGGLAKLNQDISAWLCIPGTVIDYPVVVSDQENYYLRRDLKGKYSFHGTLYFSGKEGEYENRTNWLIYGHHMKDGSMFAGLMNYENPSYAEKYNTIYLYTKSEDFLYRVVGAFKTDVSEDNEEAFRYSQYLSIQTKQKWEDFLDHYHDCKLYDLQGTIRFGDRLLMLSTCEYSTENGRLVVLCKRVEEES